ncbi:MAG: hypothetical protein LBU65_15380 [Planctomycetaceae bacterium]|nr:hypothetical protein [Planctomycetaceae bacterium]
MTTRYFLSFFFGAVFCFAALDSQGSVVDEVTLDKPILFVKRHNYLGLHIYDTYYKWRPGGGIYVLENPDGAARGDVAKVRVVIDGESANSLGKGVYSDPDLSFDGKRVLFCYKGEQHGGTSIYEIGIDGTGLRQVTNSKINVCNQYCGVHGGNHDTMPAYLPDGRIVFTSTRYIGLVPCANEGVNILHVMNADGSDIHPISVNNVNEFDPSVMPDGRILFGRWEYIDKTALTQQSTWSVNPDGTNETAVFANNLVLPEATLQNQVVPGNPNLVCSAFTKHNCPPRGSIAMFDIRKGKDNIEAIYNFEHPDNPTCDLGESCDPQPLSENLVLYSGQLAPKQKNSLLLIDRSGKRKQILYDASIDLHNPIIVSPRPVPPSIADQVDRTKTEGNFFVQDVYAGNPTVKKGTIKYLRVIEETSRISPTPGPTFLNQTYVVSAALAFSAKNFLGEVPVNADGSAYFTVPSGKAVYFQLLDEQHKLVRSMRTFIQAAPGTTRSCVGCHEYEIAPKTMTAHRFNSSLKSEPIRLRAESWGSGPIDYASMVQPIFDKHCVECHGGEKGIEGGLDLTGGWTAYFNNSYENLVSRREVIYKSPLIGAIDCMNGTAYYSAQILDAYQHGSGNAPLADIVLSGHKDKVNLSQTEKELVLAWIDTNGLYYGTWNFTKHGYSLPIWDTVKTELTKIMQENGCAKCHADSKGNISRFEADWINLEKPELSRILRAPLAKDSAGYGLGFCRNVPVDQNWRRVRMLNNSQYQHAVVPLSSFPTQELRRWDKSGEAVVSFESPNNAVYQRMLALLTAAHDAALSSPRIDMPGGNSVAGQFRQIHPMQLPQKLPKLSATINVKDATVLLTWDRSTETFGLNFYLYRNGELINETTAHSYVDEPTSAGLTKYELVLEGNGVRSKPIAIEVEVPEIPEKPTREPFEVTLTDNITSHFSTLKGDAKITSEGLQVTKGGMVFPFKNLNIDKTFVLDFDVKLDSADAMPVLVSYGRWNQSGWFIQGLNGTWRFHIAGTDCDGGKVPVGQWVHITCKYDGKSMTVSQDGKTVAEKQVQLNKPKVWGGSLVIGNYEETNFGQQHQMKGTIKNVMIGETL